MFRLTIKHVLMLSATLSYMHWGEMVEDVVDERGEVALLSRNIVIRGEMLDECPAANGNCDKYSYDTFGGHTKVLLSFSHGCINFVCMLMKPCNI